MSYINNEILVTDDLIIDFYEERLTYERISDLIEKSDKWQWILYPIIPVYYLLKFFIVAICLYTGVLLAGYSVNFTKLFHVAMFSELVFFVSSVIKILWFGVFFTEYTLQDLQFFSPLSLLSFLDKDFIEPWLVYPFQLLNIFEVIYWLLLAYGLYSLINERFLKMFWLVTCSYGVGLLLWVVFVVFLTVSISPA